MSQRGLTPEQAHRYGWQGASEPFAAWLTQADACCAVMFGMPAIEDQYECVDWAHAFYSGATPFEAAFSQWWALGGFTS